MPIFNYECNSCSHKQTELVSMSQVDKEVCCEKCGNLSKKLVQDSIGIAFKGPGFYSTDNNRGRFGNL